MTDQQQIAWHRRYTKDQIKELQKALNDATPPEYRERGGAGIKVDGIFGSETLKALKRVQGYHPELKVDGLAGDRTLAVLGLLTTDTFNDPQLPPTIKGINQSRKSDDWKVSPEEARQAIEDLRYAYSHPIELNAGYEKPLKLVPYGEMAKAFIKMGVGQRALYNLAPSEYEKELLALLPKEIENQFSDEDQEFIEKQLNELKRQNPQKAEEYKKFLKENLSQQLALNGYNRYTSKEFYSGKPEYEFFELMSQIPSLKGSFISNEEAKNIRQNRNYNYGLSTAYDEGYVTQIPYGVVAPSWESYASYADKPIELLKPREIKFSLFEKRKRGGRIDYINLYK